MKNSKLAALLVLFVFTMASSVFALKGVVADKEDIERLKKDLLAGKISIGATRLMHIQNEYGEAPNIFDDERRVTYDYGDLRLTFDRSRIWKEWNKDSFRDPVYTDDVDDLRFDLESGELVGENIKFSSLRRSYGEPTESFETDSDGDRSIYYYGNIRLVFENVISVTSWRGANLGSQNQEDISTADVYQTQDIVLPPPEKPVEEPAP